MKKAQFFHDVRLSEHFVLSDFMQSPAVYNARVPLTLKHITKAHYFAGKALCEDLLEEMISLYGPCSVAAGLLPAECSQGHPPGSPHNWGPMGAAADLVFHNWVNAHKAPINLVADLMAENNFHRMITYAGSEFICASWRKIPLWETHRNAVIENQRTGPGQRTQLKHKWTTDMPERSNWRRHEHELPSNSPELRSHHIRVGKYFTLADFCRSPHAYGTGKPWMVPPGHEPQTTYARMAAELLSPLVERCGRVSIIRGLMPRHLAELEKYPDLWTWRQGPAGLEFRLPASCEARMAVDALRNQSWFEDFTAIDTDQGMIFSLVFRPFKPKKIWHSHVAPPEPKRRALDI